MSRPAAKPTAAPLDIETPVVAFDPTKCRACRQALDLTPAAIGSWSLDALNVAIGLSVCQTCLARELGLL